MVELKYVDGRASMTFIHRLSKPSLRRYTGVDEIPLVNAGMGIVIMTTPLGVMTGKEAKKRQVGGELLCEVY